MKITLMLTLAFGLTAASANAATILERLGESSFQCCTFAAVAMTWTQADTWSGVQIDVQMNNNGEIGETRLGVFYLTTSLGPGTTEAADEVDESIVSTDVPGVQLINAFKGLTLGPGTYHLVYHSAPGSVFGDDLQLTFNAAPLIAGPGVTGGFHQFQEAFGVEAPYRPASAFEEFQRENMLFRITGTRETAPVPEPSTSVAVAFALACAVWQPRQRVYGAFRTGTITSLPGIQATSRPSLICPAATPSGTATSTR